MDLKTGDTRLIIDACKKYNLLRNQAAYVLATAYHETAHTMKPVREYGGEAYLRKKKYWPYVGMGYVQITWAENYRKASGYLGVDFLANPKLLLKPEYAAPILVVGMAKGWFTDRKLADYITLYKSDFRQARKIVNGMDKADQIAGYAKLYDDLLKADGYGEFPLPDPKPPVKVEKQGWLAWFLSFFRSN
jgi:predicted chitinase